MSENLKIGIIEDLYKKNEELIISKDAQIKFLGNQLLKHRLEQYPIKDIEAELKVQYPTLLSLVLGDMVSSDQDTISHAIVTFPNIIYKKDKRKIAAWLQVKSYVDSLIVVFH